MTTPTAMGMLFDVTRCTGCRQCVKACLAKEGVERKPAEVTELSDRALTCVVEKDGEAVRNMCRHCVDPSCASVCPVGALRKDPLGPVTYDAGKCIGCRYCMVACPFNIPRYQWDEPVPALKKCNLCFERVKEGGKPACVEACTYEATVFGPREQLIAEAHDRIREAPEDYYDHVYGEREIGGTSVLFLTPRPMEELGYKAILGTEPLPGLTKKQLYRVPGIVVGGAAVLCAIWSFTKRRDEVAEWEARRRRHPEERGGDRFGREVRHDDR